MADVTESALTRDDADIIGKTIIAEAVHGLCYGKRTRTAVVDGHELNIVIGVECLFFIAALYKLS